MSEPQVIREIGPLRQLLDAVRMRQQSIALVPTMGRCTPGMPSYSVSRVRMPISSWRAFS